MMENPALRRDRKPEEPDRDYRADVDQSGDWFVWRRIGTNGWATMRRCATHLDAVELAESLNLAEESTVG